ncbi:hypothetical protein CMK11_19015 [Candidatus Poribacteria bacterium]|nr:hypothetical protein [Candidatus Poribacteria bacterium]
MDFAALTAIPWQMVALTVMALSLGWGIRGNFGHESGAAMPGALAAMAVAIMSGRPDWWERAHLFAMFGALGWSLGGSMSYMQVIAFTHSGHTPSILYGFANLGVIGFCWAALGGLGVGVAALFDGATLALFGLPIVLVLAGWGLQETIVDAMAAKNSGRRHESRLYWYDTDWLEVLVAAAAVLVVVALRGRFDPATTLILYLGVGWYGAFLLLVNVLGLRMTPPRGDNWAGCVGMVIGASAYCWRFGYGDLAFAMWMTGAIGGAGYSLSQAIKLACIRTGLRTNWHSVLEQTQGAFHGLGLSVAMGVLAQRAPAHEAGGVSRWMHVAAVAFTLVLLTYVNHRKATLTWIEQVASLPERFYRIPTAGWFRRSRGWIGWFELVYLAIGVAVVWIGAAHLRSPLPFLPESALGRAQLLFLLFMWWIVVFNFERALTGFTPARIITEGAITWNAVACTVFVCLGATSVALVETSGAAAATSAAVTAAVLGVVCVTVAGWTVAKGLFGSEHISDAGLHIRFGPNRTATKQRPTRGSAHP